MGMSQDQQGGGSNPKPVDVFVTFNMKEGKFYRKERDGEKELIGSKLKFIVVDDGLASITGFHQQSGKRAWSNYIYKGKGDLSLYVYPKNGPRRLLKQGNYKKDIKDYMPSFEKYTKHLYIYLVATKRFALLQLHGTCLGAYTDHLVNDTENKYSAEGRLINITKSDKKENGYYAPVFQSRKLDEENEKEKAIIDICVEFDKEEIQPWIKRALNYEATGETTQPSSEPEEVAVEEPEESSDPADDDLPF